jgi:hypothetical protein
LTVNRLSETKCHAVSGRPDRHCLSCSGEGY